jgi:hypothetical protein
MGSACYHTGILLYLYWGYAKSRHAHIYFIQCLFLHTSTVESIFSGHMCSAVQWILTYATFVMYRSLET